MWSLLKTTVKRFEGNNLTDWAAALTYYGVLSVFPGLLVLVSIFGLAGRPATGPLIDDLGRIAPGPVHDILGEAATGLEQSGGSGWVLGLSLAAAFWAASGYIGAFIRASNVVNGVTETRKIWWTIPLRLGVTLAVGVIIAVCGIIIVFTGGLARYVGDLIGAGDAAITVWGIVKWPVLLFLVNFGFSILYWASPDARTGGFRWFSAGSLTAVVLWVAASAGFGLYAANFGSYNKTYGTLGGVIVFLVWLWISNLAVLFGAEIDAARRAKAGPAPEDASPAKEE